MDTKWKKSKRWKMAVSLGAWALSLSILLACAVANPVRIFGGMEEFRAVAEPGSTWKQTEWFRLEIAEMLEDLIRIGAGQPVLSVDIATETAEKDAAAGVSYAVSEESVSYGSVLIGYIRGWASESAAEQESSAATTEDSGEKKWTPEEIERSAELFLKQHESDKNILYELKQDGQALYDNLEGQAAPCCSGAKENLEEAANPISPIQMTVMMITQCFVLMENRFFFFMILLINTCASFPCFWPERPSAKAFYV